MMMKSIHKFLRRESGASVIEFVIVVPFLLLIIFSMISWGYSLTLLDAMNDAARKAARDISVGRATAAQVTSINYLDSPIQTLDSNWPQSFNVTATDTSPAGGTEVTVVITTGNFFEFMRPIVPGLPLLEAEVRMRKEL